MMQCFFRVSMQAVRTWHLTFPARDRVRSEQPVQKKNEELAAVRSTPYSAGGADGNGDTK